MSPVNSSRSAETMYPTIESYLNSDISQKLFCEQHELPYSVFIYWLRHYRKNQQVSEPFLPVHIDHRVSGSGKCLIELAGGPTVCIEGLSDSLLLSALNLLLDH